MSARKSGWAKAIIQATAIFMVMIADILRYGPWQFGENGFFNTIMNAIVFYALLGAAAFTFYSGIDYYFGAQKILREAANS